MRTTLLVHRVLDSIQTASSPSLGEHQKNHQAILSTLTVLWPIRLSLQTASRTPDLTVF